MYFNNLSILQLNLQKSPTGLSLIIKECLHLNIDILILQELPFNKDKITGLPSSLISRTLHGPPFMDKLYSAIIILNENIFFSFHDELSNFFFTTVEIHLKNLNILIVSSYFHTNSNLTNDLNFLSQICNSSKNKGIIVGVDTNAHSNLWHCTNNDFRGFILEEFLMESNLHIINLPDSPTWSSITKSSSIDLSLVSPLIHKQLIEWKTDESLGISDHIPILMSFNLNANTNLKKESSYFKRFNLNKADWKKFSCSIENEIAFIHQKILTVSDSQEFNLAVDDLMSLISKAAITSIPLKPQRIIQFKPCHWWNHHLESLKKTNNKLRILSRKTKWPSTNSLVKSIYNKHKKLYVQQIIKAKQDSWKKFCDASNISPWGKIFSFIKDHQSTQVNLLNVRDNTGALLLLLLHHSLNNFVPNSHHTTSCILSLQPQTSIFMHCLMILILL